MNFTINIRVTKQGTVTRIPECSDIGTEILERLFADDSEIYEHLEMIQGWVSTHGPDIRIVVPFHIATKWACFRHTNTTSLELSHDLLEGCWSLKFEGDCITAVIDKDKILSMLEEFIKTTATWEFPKRILSADDYNVSEFRDTTGTYVKR